MDLIINENETKNVFIDDLNEYNIIVNKNATLNLNYSLKSAKNNILLNGKVDQNANLNINLLDYSSGNLKLKVNFDLMENATANWNLASISSDSDIKSYDISFNHLKEKSTAKVNNYGVSLNESKLSFLGTNSIKKGAKKSNTSQISKIIVFDKKAKASANPILKIDENDVLAFHSACIGKVNEEHLFYLKSKGLDEKTAKSLIVAGYIKPIADKFDDSIKSSIEKTILEKIHD